MKCSGINPFDDASCGPSRNNFPGFDDMMRNTSKRSSKGNLKEGAGVEVGRSGGDREGSNKDDEEMPRRSPARMVTGEFGTPSSEGRLCAASTPGSSASNGNLNLSIGTRSALNSHIHNVISQGNFEGSTLSYEDAEGAKPASRATSVDPHSSNWTNNTPSGLGTRNDGADGFFHGTPSKLQHLKTPEENKGWKDAATLRGADYSFDDDDDDDGDDDDDDDHQDHSKSSTPLAQADKCMADIFMDIVKQQDMEEREEESFREGDADDSFMEQDTNDNASTSPAAARNGNGVDEDILMTPGLSPLHHNPGSSGTHRMSGNPHAYMSPPPSSSAGGFIMSPIPASKATPDLCGRRPCHTPKSSSRELSSEFEQVASSGDIAAATRVPDSPFITMDPMLHTSQIQKSSVMKGNYGNYRGEGGGGRFVRDRYRQELGHELSKSEVSGGNLGDSLKSVSLLESFDETAAANIAGRVKLDSSSGREESAASGFEVDGKWERAGEGEGQGERQEEGEGDNKDTMMMMMVGSPPQTFNEHHSDTSLPFNPQMTMSGMMKEAKEFGMQNFHDMYEYSEFISKHCARPKRSPVPAPMTAINSNIITSSLDDHNGASETAPASRYQPTRGFGREAMFSDGTKLDGGLTMSSFGGADLETAAENRENVDFWKRRLGSRYAFS